MILLSVMGPLPGSSPRGRGKQTAASRCFARFGLIPARAGKTQERVPGIGHVAAHPRAGGENMSASVAACCASGSSPRGRGKRRPPRLGRGHVRLIPARAGKTRVRNGMEPFREAHPRAGGENVRGPDAVQALGGSSPRGRGKRHAVRACGDPSGLIPARAGKTRARRPNVAHKSAHPRAGGENCRRIVLPASGLGSSPRGRGKRRPPWLRRRHVRLIPARAGKTCQAGSTPTTLTAHPRAGGENWVCPPGRSGSPGSSPRGRGKRDGLVWVGVGEGLIPARAGKTLSDLRFYRADRSDLGNP